MKRVELFVRYTTDERFPTRRCGLVRLPEHDGSGLLDWVLRANCMNWLREFVPEDLYQEAAYFLLSEEWDLDSYQGRNRFIREARRHFYCFITESGFRRARGSGSYTRKNVGSCPERMNRFRNRRSATEQVQDEMDYQAIFERCHDDDERNALVAYSQGCTEHQIADLVGCEVEVLWPWLEGVMLRIRDELQIAAEEGMELPIPVRPSIGHPVNQERVGAGERQGDTPRVFVGTPRQLQQMSLEDIQMLFGVSRATAHRIRKRGWYCPNHKNSTTAEQTGVVARKAEPEIPEELRRIAENPTPDEQGRVHVPVELAQTVRTGRLMEIFGVSRSTVLHMKTRGWYCPRN